MNLNLRKGWCPGALRPMMARDGLLVRLRITGGIVPADTARSLAELAGAYGNSLFDLSARANLQMRGVRESALPALLDGLRELGLLDATGGGEAIRNIIASPLAGLGSGLDIRPITACLDAALAEDRGLHGLPGKFGFLIDDGGAPSLAHVAGDVRLDWSAAHHAFAIGLGGTRDEATFAGFCAADAVVSCGQDIARKVVALQHAGGLPRRMRSLLHDLGPAAAGLFGTQPDRPFERGADGHDLAGRQTFGEQPVLGLTVPFGRLDAAMLREAATLAEKGFGELRLTPWRTILVPEAGHGRPKVETRRSRPPARHPRPAASVSSGASPVFPGMDGRHKPGHDNSSWAHTAGFITNPTDPRLRVAACAGRDGCARGTTSTHADATALADIAGSLGGEPTPLHVSGCEKGCAKPSRSAVTLVGRDGRYDLVRDGRPGDTPALRGLDLAQVRAALTRNPVRERAPA